MTGHRHKLWRNIMEDLGPPEGCIVPMWLRLVYAMLFPLHGLKVLLNDALGFDYLRMVWTIHGVDYSDRLFANFAAAEGETFKVTRINNVVTVERVSP